MRKYYQENLGNIEENQMRQHTIDFLKLCKQFHDFSLLYIEFSQ